MRIQTFSIVAGTEICPGECPYCVSKMTPSLGMDLMNLKEPEVNWRNFDIACRLAQQSGVTTAMLTGKGEPTVYPGQITKYLEAMRKYNFPLIEMQTDGLLLSWHEEWQRPHLAEWYKLGMTTIAISVVHYDAEKNRQIFCRTKPSYIDLPKLIEMLHEYGFSVRLSCVAARGFVDCVDEFKAMAFFAKEHGVEQLTITPVNRPDETRSRNREVWDWINTNCLSKEQIGEIKSCLDAHGTQLMNLAHGAIVYDLDGQNVCLSNCLAVQPASGEIRNLIFFPDGHLRYYWQYPGAILL